MVVILVTSTLIRLATIIKKKKKRLYECEVRRLLQHFGRHGHEPPAEAHLDLSHFCALIEAQGLLRPAVRRKQTSAPTIIIHKSSCINHHRHHRHHRHRSAPIPPSSDLATCAGLSRRQIIIIILI